MPFVRVETTESIDPQNKSLLISRLSQVCAETLGKPEQYMMVAIHDQATMLFGGATGPAAFVDVKVLGTFEPKTTDAASKGVCSLLTEAIGVPGNRIFLNFTEVSGPNWGTNGATFG
jgi:phenylpyruvate tautomerase